MPAPLGRVLVHVGYACNNRCVFCAQGDLRAEAPAEEADAVRAALREGREGGHEAVAFVGGEPTLSDALPALIAEARRLGYTSVLLQTNGRRLAYGGYARDLAGAGLHGVDVSLAGPKSAVHDYHVRVDGAFKQTGRGIAAARAAGLGVSVTSVLTRSSYRHLEETVRLLARLGVDAIHLAAPRGEGEARAGFDRVVPPLSLAMPHLEAAAAAARSLGVPLLLGGLPLCVLPERLRPALIEHHVEGAGEGRVFGAACERCALRPACPGLDAAYAERFGEGELAARPDADPKALLRAAASFRGAASRFAGPGLVAARAVR